MPQNNVFLNFISPAKALKPASLDYQGDVLVSQAHGTKYWETYNKNVFFACNQAGITTSAGLATTYTGICLSNPAASTKNLAILNVSGGLIVAPSTITTLALIVGYSAAGIVTHTTPITSLQSTFLGNAAVPQGLVDGACTLVGTPAYNRVLGQCGTATTSVAFNLEINGAIIVPPGGYVAIGTNIASPASGFLGSIEWEEVAP